MTENIQNLAIQDILFPYSREYFEMCRDCFLVECEETLLAQNDVFIEGVFQSIADMIKKIFIKIQKAFRRFISFFTGFYEKINDPKQVETEKKNGTLIREICSNGHIWQPKEIEQMINTSKSGTLAYWAQVSVSTLDPAIHQLRFDTSCSKIHKLAFMNFLNFMLIRDQDAMIDVGTICADKKQPNSSNGGKREFDILRNFSMTNAVISSAVKTSVAGIFIFALPTIIDMSKYLITLIREARYKELKKWYGQFNQKAAIKADEYRGLKIKIQKEIDDGPENIERLKELQNELEKVDQELQNIAKQDVKAWDKVQSMKEKIDKYYEPKGVEVKIPIKVPSVNVSLKNKSLAVKLKDVGPKIRVDFLNLATMVVGLLVTVVGFSMFSYQGFAFKMDLLQMKANGIYNLANMILQNIKKAR